MNKNDNLQGTASPPSDEKGSTKTFTQSDFDSLIAREKRKLESKYEGFDDLKTEIDKLRQEKEERENRELSEIDKLKKDISKLKDDKKTYESQIKGYALKDKKQKILSDPKYKDLPLVYRNAIAVDEDETKIQDSADEILEQFRNDVDSIKGNNKSFGLPLKHEPSDNDKKPTSMAQLIAQKWKDKHAK